MEYAAGGTLAGAIKVQYTKREPFETAAVLRWCGQLGSALACVHRHGLLHRDVSTQNVLLAADSTIRLCDFGVSRDLGENSMATSSCDQRPVSSWASVRSRGATSRARRAAPS